MKYDQALTEPIGTVHAKAEPMHVDDWLDKVECNLPRGTAYAKWWLENFRLPAWKKMLYRPMMKDYRLYCVYQDKLYRCIGCSRMGDVWLARSFDRENGYDLRVNVEDCSDWNDQPISELHMIEETK